MASNSKRSWQVQEFVAHDANVNCLALGQKSGRVLVTGGDDKKVNLWCIQQPNGIINIMSLSGHLTPVECVKFDHVEEIVCAGSQAGALKLWNLEVEKLVRTLTGHRSGIKCVDFHPYGNYFASGSLDASIKLWDHRRRECISTYKDHQETVNSLKFSPDGQWIASGGEEGEVKIWDLRHGRVLQRFNGHSGAVTDVEFHPQEFLLASSSADRSVSFWDLENFHLVSKIEKETALIRCLLFSDDGKCLFGGCAEQLKVFGWEPARVFDTVTIGWGKVHGMATAMDLLYGASFSLTRVSICAVDVNKISRTSAVTSQTSQTSPFKHNQTTRKSFNKQKPKPKPSVEVKPIDEEFDTDDGVNSFVPDNYESVFKPHRSLNRSPPPPDYDSSFQSPVSCRRPFSESSGDEYVVPVASAAPKTSKRVVQENIEPQYPVSIAQHSKLPEHRVPSPMLHRQTSSQSASHTAKTAVNGQLSPLPKPVREELRRTNSSKNGSTSGNTFLEVAESSSEPALPDVVARNRKVVSSESHSRVTTKPAVEQPSKVPYDNENRKTELVPSMSNTPVDLSLEEFLPVSYRNGGLKSQLAHPNLSENEVISSLTRNHEMVLTILKIRQRNLEIIYSLWHNQDLKCALEGAISMNDQAVLVDVLSAINKRPSLWNLDVCVVLLPAIYNLLHSKYEMYMSVCCDSLQLILKNFSSVIKTNVQWSSPTIGVDISKEERYAKCVKCYDNLISIRTFLLKRQTMQGKLGQSFRELQSMLYAIEK